MTPVRALAGLALAALLGIALSPFFFSSASALDGSFVTDPRTSTTSITSTTSTTLVSTPVTTDGAAAVVEEADPTGGFLDPLADVIGGLDGSTEPSGDDQSPVDQNPTAAPEDDPGGDDTAAPTPASPTSPAAIEATQGTTRVTRPADSRVVGAAPAARGAPQQPAATLPETRPGGVAAPVPDVSARRLGPQPDGGRPTTIVLKEKSGPRTTAELFALLDLLDLAPAALGRLVAPFPVAGLAHYSADFGEIRRDPGGVVRQHQGTDVFAARGTPVVAAARGLVTLGSGGRSGSFVVLEAPDGTHYLYAHLDRFAARLATGDTVAKGEVIGFVGTSGNAAATAPHLHFEVRPAGGAAIDPVPFLDRWLADATRSIASLRGTSLSPAAVGGSALGARSTIITTHWRAPSFAEARPAEVPTAREIWTNPIAMMRTMSAPGVGAVVPMVGAVLVAFALRRGGAARIPER